MGIEIFKQKLMFYFQFIYIDTVCYNLYNTKNLP